MTDKQIFQNFVRMMGLTKTDEAKLENSTIVIYSTDSGFDKRITVRGYDDISIGAEFDKNDNLIKGFLDAHVAYVSENHNLLRNKIFDHQKRQQELNFGN